MAETVLAKLQVLVAANTAELKKGFASAKSEFSSFTGGLTKLAGTLGVAFGVQQVADFAFEVSKLAGEAEGVKAAFDKLPNSVQLMDQLKESTAGTVSELDLMKRTVQASNFGISLKALPDLLQFASIRAQQTGQSVDYLVDSIITGIGRKSPLILDNLGISAVRLKEKFGGAALEAQSIGDVAEAVGKIATEELSKMGDFSENTSTKVQRLGAEWENFKVQLGGAANNTDLLGEAIDDLNILLKNLSTFLASDASNGLKEYLKLVLLVPRYTLKAAGAGLQWVNDLNTLEAAIKDFNEEFEDTPFAQQFDFANGGKFASALEVLKKKADESGKSLLVLTDDVTGLTKVMVDIRSKPVVVIDDGSAKDQIHNLEELQAKLKDLNDQFEKDVDRGDTSKLASIGNEIKSTQKLIAEIEKYRKEEKAANEEKRRSIDLTNLQAQSFLQVATEFNNVKEAARKSAEEISKFINAFNPIAKLPEKIKISDGLRADVDNFLAGFKQIGTQIQEEAIEIGGMVANGISGIADALGESLAGGNFKDFGKGLLEAVASFAQQLGSLMVAMGIGEIALKGLPGPAKVAAGLALIVAGSAIKKLMSSQKSFPNAGPSGSGGGGGRGTSTNTATSFPTTAQDSMNIQVDDVRIAGQDIWLSFKAYEQNGRFTKTGK